MEAKAERHEKTKRHGEMREREREKKHGVAVGNRDGEGEGVKTRQSHRAGGDRETRRK